MNVFLLILLIAIIALWVLVKPARVTKEQKERFVGTFFAHRGLHTKDLSVPENSLAAFKAAADAGYGLELDIQLSKDGHVMAFHDDTVDRLCKATGNVNEFTAQELKEMKLLDTEETIPYFKDVLDTVAGKAPIMVELKPTLTHRDELCEKTYELLKNYDGEYFIESFDPNILVWFKKNAPEVIRGQLVDTMKNYVGVPLFERLILSHVFMNFAAKPHFIGHGLDGKSFAVLLSEGMGALKSCWTSDDTRDTEKLHRENHSVTFEFYMPNKNEHGDK